MMELVRKIVEGLFSIHESIIDFMMKDGTLVSREAASMNLLLYAFMISIVVIAFKEPIVDILDMVLYILECLLKLLLKAIMYLAKISLIFLRHAAKMIDKKVILRWNHSQTRRKLVGIICCIFHLQ